MSGLRILVTGSRDWTDRHLLHAALIDAIEVYGPHLIRDDGAPGDPRIDWELVTLVHGDARGADRIAASLGRALSFQVEPHPADWKTHGKAAGHIRNAEMVALGADVCLAFLLGASRGARGCMDLAEKAGIPVVVTEGVPA